MNETIKAHGKRGIYFDVNQTLVRQGLTFEQCFDSVWEAYAGRWLPEEPVPHGQLWEQYNTRWQQRAKIRTSYKQLDELQQQCLREAFESLDIPVSGGMAQSFMQEVRLMQAVAKNVAPSAVETLQSLSQSYRLAIISNSPRHEVLQLLSRFELAYFFPPEHVFTAHKPSDKKPAPHLFRSALQAFQLAPRQAIMVGNSWKHDVCGAVKAGMDAVWLQPSSSDSRESDGKTISQQRLGRRHVYLINQMKQLKELLM